jgi:Pyridoxamine 5'-phosphate oxidase
MATASKDGCVNTAVYARPHVIDEQTMVWGMTEGRTYRNITENPRASFLFMVSCPGFSGVRLALELVKTEESGLLLEKIKEIAETTVGPGTGAAVTHAVWFTVTEVRSLI